MKKKIIKGWMAKYRGIDDIILLYESKKEYACKDIYKKKGRLDTWDEYAWPPKHIKITIEEIE